MTIQVGFGREKITPDFPCFLAGGSYPKRIHTNVLEDIFAHCVAITDEKGTTSLIFALDIVSTAAPITNALRETAGGPCFLFRDPHPLCTRIWRWQRGRH